MMRAIGVVLSAALLGACSSGGGSNPVLSAVWDKIKPGSRAAAEALVAEQAARTPIVLTFEKIQDTGLAIIRARVGDDTKGVLLYARSLNDDYVTYASQLQQTLTLRGSLITASRGIDTDLLALRSDMDDPVAVLTVPQDWPENITRDYHMPGDGPSGTVISVNCQLTAGPDFELALLDKVFETRVMQYACDGDGVSFINTHLVDATGQIMQSTQWLGPRQGSIEIDVLEPFTLEE